MHQAMSGAAAELSAPMVLREEAPPQRVEEIKSK
jgi:hypothetical protein